MLRFSYTAVSIERRDIEHEFVKILEEEVFNGVADDIFERQLVETSKPQPLDLSIVRKADVLKKELFEIVARAALS